MKHSAIIWLLGIVLAAPATSLAAPLGPSTYIDIWLEEYSPGCTSSSFTSPTYTVGTVDCNGGIKGKYSAGANQTSVWLRNEYFTYLPLDEGINLEVGASTGFLFYVSGGKGKTPVDLHFGGGGPHGGYSVYELGSGSGPICSDQVGGSRVYDCTTELEFGKLYEARLSIYGHAFPYDLGDYQQIDFGGARGLKPGVEFHIIPEPGFLPLVGGALLAIGLLRRRTGGVSR